MTIVEALAAGCPVVSTDVGVAKEAGALVAPRDSQVFARKIHEALLADKPLAPAPLSREAYLHALKQSWHKAVGIASC